MVKILGAFPAWAYVHSSYVVVTKIGDVLYYIVQVKVYS
jgi:hypothetical protein